MVKSHVLQKLHSNLLIYLHSIWVYFKVIYPKYYKNSNEYCILLFLGKLGRQGSTRNYFNFDKVSKYLNSEGGCVCFRGENKYELDFLYLALDSRLSWTLTPGFTF